MTFEMSGFNTGLTSNSGIADQYYQSPDALGDMLEQDYFNLIEGLVQTGDIINAYSSTQDEYMRLRMQRIQVSAGVFIIGVTRMGVAGKGNLVIAMGSSILAHGAIDTGARFGYDVAGPVEWAMRRLGWRAPYMNRSISGQKTIDMIARLDADVLSLKPQIVIMQNGTNEISDGFALLKENSYTLYSRIIATGATLIVMGVSTRDARSGWSQKDYEAMAALNEFKRRFCEAHPKCYYVDTNATIMDPETGEAFADLTRDGTHWTPTGAYKVGDRLLPILEDLLPRTDIIPTYVAKPDNGVHFTYGNESPNPGLTGNAGAVGAGVTGDVPDKWTVERSGSHSSTAVTSIDKKALDDPRNEVSITITPSGSSDREIFFFRIQPSIIRIQQPNDFYEGLMGIDVDAWDGFDYIRLEVDDAGPGSKTIYDGENTYGDPMPNVAWSGLLKTPEFLPTGNLRLRVRIAIRGDATGVGTIRFSTPVLRAIDPDSRIAIPRDLPQN